MLSAAKHLYRFIQAFNEAAEMLRCAQYDGFGMFFKPGLKRIVVHFQPKAVRVL